jgi:steroid delta-isomerase-like uncharacterized protein
MTIEAWIAQVRAGVISRRKFIAKLSLIGASAGGAALLVAHALSSQQTSIPASQDQQVQQHQNHVARQSRPPLQPGEMIAPLVAGAVAELHPAMARHLAAILDDYHVDAIVEDTLTGAPIQGHAAISARKLAEMQSIGEPHIEVTRRYAFGAQLIAEWTFTGVHLGTFKNYAPTGNLIRLQGLTVVERRDGKIVKETLYYDAADAHRQLSAMNEA